MNPPAPQAPLPQATKIAIVAYKPKPGMEAALMELTREHVPLLREEGLVTAREPIVARAADGTVIEVFEWAAGALERAHSNPEVNRLWHRYAAVCEYTPLVKVAEASEMFAAFDAVEL